MTYATVEDVGLRYGETLYGMVGYDDEGELNRAPVLAALEEATAEIDAVLAMAVRDLDRQSPMLRRICIDIAVGGLGKSGAERADVYERRASDARKLLASLTGTNDDGGNKDAVIPGGGLEFVPATESVFKDMTGF